MTVLGTATRVYAGGAAAVAVYAGSVKVWPLGPPPLPPPVGHATWTEEADGRLKFEVDNPNGYTPGSYVIAVAPFPGTLTHPEYRLGHAAVALVARTYWGGQAAAVEFTVRQTITNQEAVEEWAGNLVEFTFNNSRRITDVAVLGPVPPVPQLPPAPPTKPGADGVGQWWMHDEVAPDQLVLVVTTPSGASSGTTFVIDIEPFTGTTAEAGNPYRGVVWLNGDRTQRTVLGMAAPVWNGYYPAQWGGHRLRFVIDAVNVLSFTNLGVSPA